MADTNIRKNPVGKVKDSPLPPSDKKTITPKYLLGHENHFDPMVYGTPGSLAQRGIAKPGGINVISKTALKGLSTPGAGATKA